MTGMWSRGDSAGFRVGDDVFDTVLYLRGQVVGGTKNTGAPFLAEIVVHYRFTTGRLTIAYGPYNGDGQNPISQLRHAGTAGDDE